VADAKPDCQRLRFLASEINYTNQEIDQIIRDMDRLGFGTARAIRLMKQAYQFAAFIYDNTPPIVWKVLYLFVRCDDAALAQLGVDKLKLLVQILQAHAQLQLAAVEDEDLRQDLQKWADRLAETLNGWADNQGKDEAVKVVKALKQFAETILRKGVPWILKALIEAFGDDVLKMAEDWLTNPETFQKPLIKALLKQIVYRTLAYQIGKKAAELLTPNIARIALTGWELLVEISGKGAVEDLRDYVSALLVQAVVLMEQCEPGWPQSGTGFFVPGNRYLGATVTVRPLVRCAKIIDGKPQWSGPCPLKFLVGNNRTANELTYNLTEQNQKRPGYWEFDVQIDPNSANNSPCVAGAKYCYTYLRMDFKFPGGQRAVYAVWMGVKTF
jgi:hypothetical protein